MYEEEEFEILHECATKIQKVFRGFRVRKFYQQVQNLIYQEYYDSNLKTNHPRHCEYGLKQINKRSMAHSNYPISFQMRSECGLESNAYSILTSKRTSHNPKKAKQPRKKSSFDRRSEDQVVFLTDVAQSSNESIIDALHENENLLSYGRANKINSKTTSNVSNKTSNTIKVHQIQTASQVMLNQPQSPSRRVHKISIKSPKGRPIYYEFDIYLNAALLIQKVYRGFVSRKFCCDYYRLKNAVLIIEFYMSDFLQNRLNQRKLAIKQLSAHCYSIQNQCRNFIKLRDQINNQYHKQKDDKLTKVQQMLQQTNMILYDSFLSIMIPEYIQKTQSQKVSCIDNLKQTLLQNSQVKENQLLRQELDNLTEKHLILQQKYQKLKDTHRDTLQKFITQMKESSSPSCNRVKTNPSKSSKRTGQINPKNQENIAPKQQITTQQFHQILSNQQLQRLQKFERRL